MTNLVLMRSDLEPIAHALSDKLLAVPPYQRSYAWGETHVKDLLRDITDAINDGESEYFLGSVVCSRGENNRLEIVDGQQRLATVTIIIAAIRDYFEQKGDAKRAYDIDRKFLTVRDIRTQETAPRFLLNTLNADFFSKCVLSSAGSKDREVVPDRPSHEKIKKAVQLAAEHITNLASTSSKPDDRLIDFLEYLEKKAKVIWVSVPDHANAFVIFETLNDRGLDLAISDLLKNYLFLTAENRIQEVQAQWISMLAILETVNEESIAVEYIRHLWSSKHGATRERELYGAIKDAITSKQGAVDFSKELVVNAKLYVAMLNTDHELWKKYGPTAKGHMATINMLNMVQIRPLILAVLDMFSIGEVKKALKLMVSWGVRFLVVGGLGGGTLEKQYANCAKDVREKKITTAKDLMKAMVTAVPSDKAFEASFANIVVSKAAIARYYLQVLERQKAGEENPELVTNTNQEEVTLEHVLPQTPSGDWSHIPPEIARAHYNRLGNLALMKSDENGAGSNDGFGKKKKFFAASKLVLTKEIASESNWTVSEIDVRQQKLSALASPAWSLKI